MDIEVQHRYSLFIDGQKTEEFEDWPVSWTTAPDNGGNASQRAEFEYEIEKFEKNKDVLPIKEDKLEE